MLYAIITGTVFQLIALAASLAIFETKVLEFSNPMNKTAANTCCQPSLAGSSICHLPCATFFELCLDDLHLDEPSCTFGRTKSRTFLQSSFDYNNSSLERWLNISTSLSWPGYFGIRLQAKDNTSISLPSKGIIKSSVFVDNLLPGLVWRTKREHGSTSSITYKYRVLCARNYYGKNCTDYCKPRDDEHGHYGCSENGVKYCLSGWTNIADYCKTPICSQTCQHGSCSGPNICSCTTGWSGSDCSVCETRLGCVNGTCTIPGGCECNAGWGGNNCDKETDFCGLRKPCQNGGICVNRGLGSYRCYCDPEYSGKNCETDLNPCKSSPCQNGGTCQVVGSNYKCSCSSLYTGTHCETTLGLCVSHHCQNNGTCLVRGASPVCQCHHGYTGNRCQSQITSYVPSSNFVQATRSSKHILHSEVKTNTLYSTLVFSSTKVYQATDSKLSISTVLKNTEFTLSRHTVSKSAMDASIWKTTSQSVLSYSTLQSKEDITRITRTIVRLSTQISVNHTSSSMNNPTSIISASPSSLLVRATDVYESSRKIISPTGESNTLPAYLSTSLKSVGTRKPTSSLSILPDTATQSLNTDATISIDAAVGTASTSESPALTSAIMISRQKVELRASSRRILAIGISVSISFLIIITVASIFIWSKMSKRRGALTFRRTSSIIPASMNNPCRLIDAGHFNKTIHVNNSAINNNFDSYQISHTESSSANSDHSQAISSKDICIEHNMLHMRSSSDNAKKFFNECYMNPNIGYLSEGTSGYGSENSSGRSSANCSCIQPKSPLSADGIIITRVSSYSNQNEDLPNCVVYQEEQL